MRLGDLDALQKEFEELARIMPYCDRERERDAAVRVECAPTIDPETLPIVKELRAELEKVKKERDELASLSGKLVVLCEPPQKWRPKLFRKYQGAMIGDYMGSGYPFVDDFNRIWVDFEKTASAGAYDALRKAADVAIEKVKEEEQ